MDGDRASAARKLPQTAANFFVGTRSRVPRLTLAQSSHIIPTPPSSSPGLKPSSHVVPTRLRASPFLPSSPTSTKATNSPTVRDTFNKDSKVAKAIHLFSTLTDEAGPTPLGQLDAAPTPTPLRLESEASVSTLSPSASASTDAPVSSVTCTSSELVKRLPQKDSEPHSFELKELPTTPSMQASVPAELLSTGQALPTTCSPSSDHLNNPSIAAGGQTAISPMTQICPVSARSSPGREDSADSHPFSLSLALSTSQSVLQDHADAELPSPASGSTSSAPLSNQEAPSSLNVAPMPIAASLNDITQRLISLPSASRQTNESAEELAEGNLGVSQTIFDAASSLPTFNEAIFSETSPSRSISDPQSSREVPSDLFSQDLVETAALAPKSAFSDATVPSTSTAQREVVQEQINSASHRLQDDMISPASRSWESPISRSTLEATSPLTVHVVKDASPSTSAQPISHSSPDRLEKEGKGTKKASSPSLRDSMGQPSQLSGGRTEHPILESPGPGFRPKSSDGDSNAQAISKPNKDLESFQNEASSMGSKGLRSLSPVRSSEAHVSLTPDNDEKMENQPRDRKDHHSVISDAVRESNLDAFIMCDSDHVQPKSMQDRTSKCRDLLDSQSTASDDVLLDLIDMAAVPVQVTEDVYLQDSLFERTASWIKSTMNEREPVAVEPSIFDQDEVDELTVANHVQSETAAATEPSEPHESFSIPEPSLAHNQDNLPARARFPGDQLTARTQLNVSAADPEAADCSIAAAIQRYESAPDGPNPSHDLSTKPVIGKISRSYSQRDGQGQHTVKGTRRIPGRLKIPQRQPESSATPRRDSLELLSMRRPQLSSAKDKGPSPKPVTERSYQGIGSTRADNFDDILRSWSRNNGQDPSQATPLSLGKNRVAGLVKNWDDGGGSSDDDEVAAVSTCQRMTLRRMSDFAVFNTPRRDACPAPGKLLRADSDTVPLQLSLTRPLMRVRPGLESDQAITTAAPVRRTIPQSQRQEEQSQRASSPPRRRPGYLASHTTSMKSSKSASLGPRSMAVHEAEEPRIESRLSFTRADAEEPREILRSRDSVVPASVSQRAQAAPTIRMQTTRSVKQPARAPSMRSLKLQGDHAGFITPRRGDVSVTNTSPLTILSEIWTPEASNPARSILTEETSVITTSGLRSLLTARTHSRSQTISAQDVNRQATRVQPRAATESPLHIQSRARNRFEQHACRVETRMRRSESQPIPASQTHLGIRQRRADFRLPAGHSGTRQYSTTHERGSGIKNPSFEISFELTEPKLAPHVQEGTLMEFGLRVLIKPNGAEESDSSWRLKPPSQSDMGRRSATSQRSSASIHPMQYEYNRLSNHDMIKVQQEAQEHLSRTLASPDQRKRRLHLQESYLLSPFSDPCELDRSSSLTDAGSPSSAKRALRREIKLTRERDLSPSTAPSSVVSIRKSASMGRTPSASLVSPLPYIKRAPPRTATYSSVTTQS
ncbi:uncharacterized protein SPSC_01717 [Sporisorium scitamineum]|uniref:Uncharacterized protein n=2 Tax=Sporisorium scitamineum TaxID=49012 RepID=A0A127ZBT7_9BASI|nr:uncharacterized protein SPSC_01717 [Sporisorium scitamineum]